MLTNKLIVPFPSAYDLDGFTPHQVPNQAHQQKDGRNHANAIPAESSPGPRGKERPQGTAHKVAEHEDGIVAAPRCATQRLDDGLVGDLAKLGTQIE